MSKADQVRQFVLDNHIRSARNAALESIIVRAGDVHRDMGLVNSMPSVCAAIGGHKFSQLADVVLRKTDGPANGANVYFHFDLQKTIGLQSSNPVIGCRPVGMRRPDANALDFGDAVVLVSCVKSKVSDETAARALYTSPWFALARDCVEAAGAPWFVLSARYGLVAPNTVIAPYELTLNKMSVDERRSWADSVLTALLPALTGKRRLIFLAGERYREFLIGPIEAAGFEVQMPMVGLRIGEQLAWLAAQR